MAVFRSILPAAAQSGDVARAARLAGYGAWVSGRLTEPAKAPSRTGRPWLISMRSTPNEKTSLMEEGAEWSEDKATAAAALADSPPPAAEAQGSRK